VNKDIDIYLSTDGLVWCGTAAGEWILSAGSDVSGSRLRTARSPHSTARRNAATEGQQQCQGMWPELDICQGICNRILMLHEANHMKVISAVDWWSQIWTTTYLQRHGTILTTFCTNFYPIKL